MKRARNTRRTAATRGYTLVELVITVAVASIAIAAGFATFLTQHRSFQGQESRRLMQGAQRSTATFLERTVRRAGWGVEPFISFDFDRYDALPCSSGAPCPRDRIDGSDRIVFYSRNPYYQLPPAGPVGNAWNFVDSGGTSLTVQARRGDVFPAGRILMVMCDDASSAAFVTVQNTVLAEADGEIGLPLVTASTDPFHGQDHLDTVECFETGASNGTTVFQVERTHLFVHEYDGIPWLMLDTGTDTNLDDRVDEHDWLPVAEGVEDFQVAYLMNASDAATAPDSDGNWVYGDTEDISETPNVAATAPRYQHAFLAPERFTGHPANIRAVRMTLTIRSRGEEVGVGTSPLQALENRSPGSLPPIDGYRRDTFGVIVNTPNMASRAQFLF